MKKIFYLLLAYSLTLFTSCDKGFETLNQDPNSVTGDRFNPSYLFTTVQLQTAKYGGEIAGSLYYCGGFVQQVASLSNVGIFDYHGDKYVYHKGNDEVLWKTSYDNIKLLEDVLEQSKNKPQYHNLYHMARIWKTVVYHRLTDLYGDVPYSEAGRGYYDQVFKPKYDTQKDIYYNMLAELEDAVKQLDASQSNFASSDIAYNGNLDQWKKLGYSMMLRLGMRLSKVEPATAESWVKKAYAGGVLQSNDDNLYIKGTDKAGTLEALCNADSWLFTVQQRSSGKISKTFFDFMKNHNDPRLKYTVAVYTDPTDVSTMNTDPAVQKGLPNGLDRQTLPNDPSYDPNLPGQEHQYSAINRLVYGKLDGKRMFITHAEVLFMLSEASLRGWISGNTEQLYREGVTAAMKNLKNYDESADISNAEITTYLDNYPFVGVGNVEAALNQINTQYWAATFLNGYETFANVRRSGYPVLTPVNYPDNETGGLFPGRLRYPDDEAVLNEQNYKEAVARQGADNFITHVWWDK